MAQTHKLVSVRAIMWASGADCSVHAFGSRGFLCSQGLLSEGWTGRIPNWWHWSDRGPGPEQWVWIPGEWTRAAGV